MDIVEAIKINKDYREDFITRSTYHSNAIEGNTLSYGETYAIIWNDNSFKVNTTPGELYETINHKYALSYAMDHIKEPLNKALVCHIAELINKNIDEISGYRTGAVLIKGAEYIPPQPSRVPQAMMYLLYNTERMAYDSLFDKAAEFHVKFERIHPFSDGNGRTGRILVNYLLMQNNRAPIVIEKDNRAKYFKMLADCDTKEMSIFFQKLSKTEQNRMNIFVQKAQQDNEDMRNKTFGAK